MGVAEWYTHRSYRSHPFIRALVQGSRAESAQTVRQCALRVSGKPGWPSAAGSRPASSTRICPRRAGGRVVEGSGLFNPPSESSTLVRTQPCTLRSCRGAWPSPPRCQRGDRGFEPSGPRWCAPAPCGTPRQTARSDVNPARTAVVEAGPKSRSGLALWFNGRTPGFDPGGGGSSPPGVVAPMRRSGGCAGRSPKPARGGSTPSRRASSGV